jgi:alpha-D-xyloside xylohydrolase
MRLTQLAAAALMLATGTHALAGSYQKTATGIDVIPDTGPPNWCA